MKNTHQKRFRILQIITHLPVGGASETVLSILSGLPGYYYDLTLYLGIDKHINAKEGDYLHLLEREAIQFKMSKYLSRNINIFKDIAAVFELTFYLRNNHFDIVHIHSSKAGMLGRLATFFAGQTHVIYTIHGWSFNDFQNKFIKWLYVILERIMSRITTKLITVTHLDIKKGLAHKIGHPDKYCCIRSGINIAKYSGDHINDILEFKNKYNITKNDFLIGTVSRLSTQKDPLTFVKVAKNVIAQNTNIKFIIIGGGLLDSQIKDYIGQNGLTDKIIMTGPRNDIPKILGAFDIFLSTSLWEGLPRTLLQAIAAKIPIVATEVDGVSEIILHNVTGLLVKPKDIPGITAAINHLIHNNNVAKELSNNASNILSEYSEQKMIDDLNDLYLDVLHPKSIESSNPNHNDQ